MKRTKRGILLVILVVLAVLCNSYVSVACGVQALVVSTEFPYSSFYNSKVTVTYGAQTETAYTTSNNGNCPGGCSNPCGSTGCAYWAYISSTDLNIPDGATYTATAEPPPGVTGYLTTTHTETADCFSLYTAPSIFLCLDPDLDGYSSSVIANADCGPVDCDDGNGYSFPTNTNSYCDCDNTDGYDGSTSIATESCTGGIDEDCDGLIDNEDPNCGCSPSTEVCDDGIDNDCDNDIDCDDAACVGDAACVSCAATESPNELTCNDNTDNDCDGDIDCEDSDCDDWTNIWLESEAKLFKAAVYIVEFNGAMYATSGDYGAIRSDDAGDTWTYSGLADKGVFPLIKSGTKLYTGAMDSNNPIIYLYDGTTLSEFADLGAEFDAWDATNDLIYRTPNLRDRNPQRVLALIHADDGTSDGVFIAGTYPDGGIFRSDDDGATWSYMNLRDQGFVNPFNGYEQYSTGYGIYTNTLLQVGGRILLGTTDTEGYVFYSDDYGATWQKSNQLLDSSNRVAASVLSLIEEEGAIYAGTAIKNINEPAVFKSTNNGIDWQIKGDIGVSDESARSLLYSDGILYVGTKADEGDGIAGIYQSKDDGATWSYTGNFRRNTGPIINNRVDRVYTLYEALDGSIFAGTSKPGLTSNYNPIFKKHCTICIDGDGDDYGAEGTELIICPASGTEEDCDDTDPSINPGATEICDDSLDNDCDDESDYDSIDGLHGDNDCAVGVTLTSVSDSEPIGGTMIDIVCTSTIADVNSIFAYIDENSNGVYDSGDIHCSWKGDPWSGNQITFKDCNVGLEGSKNAACGVYSSSTEPFDRSYQTGPDDTASLNVISSICSSLDLTDCGLNPSCEWCPSCSGTQYSSGAERCVEVDSCVYYCDVNQCGAECDGSTDCLAKGFTEGTYSCDMLTCIFDDSGCDGTCTQDSDCVSEFCDEGTCTTHPKCTLGASVQVVSGDMTKDFRNPSIAWTGSSYGIVWDYKLWYLDSSGGDDVVMSNSTGYFTMHDSSGNPIDMNGDTNIDFDDRIKISDTMQEIGNTIEISSDPHIVWNPLDNEFGLVYVEQDSWINPPNVAFVRLDTSGQKLGTPLVFLEGSTPYLMWNEDKQEYAVVYSRGNAINVARVNRLGNLISNVELSSGGPVEMPTLTWSPTFNEYGVVWSDGRSGTSQIYFGRISGTDGTEVLNEVPITASPFDSSRPSIAWDGTNYIVSLSYGVSSSLNADNELWAYILDQAGNVLTGETFGPHQITDVGSVRTSAVLYDGANSVIYSVDYPLLQFQTVLLSRTDGSSITNQEIASGIGFGAVSIIWNQDIQEYVVINGGSSSVYYHTLNCPTITQCSDADGDSYNDAACGGTDCDDANPDINPGATEICDGLDNDCNNQFDEGCDDDNDDYCDGDMDFTELENVVPVKIGNLMGGEETYALDGSNIVYSADVGGKMAVFKCTAGVDCKSGGTMLSDAGAAHSIVGDIDGNYVVWSTQDYATHYYGVVLHDLDTGTSQEIFSTTKEHNSTSFAKVQGNTIIWYVAGKGAYMYDITDGVPILIGDYLRPDLYGNRIVWHEQLPDFKSGIFYCNIDDDCAVKTQIGIGYHPRIYEDKVVYRYLRQMKMYDFSTAQEYVIKDSPESKFRPYVYGNKIVWHQWVADVGTGIMLYDLGVDGIPSEDDSETNLAVGYIGNNVDTTVYISDETILWNDYYIGFTCMAGGDCDDSVFEVNPGATEVCGNTIDDDCDGLEEECAAGCTVEGDVYDLYTYNKMPGVMVLITIDSGTGTTTQGVTADASGHYQFDITTAGTIVSWETAETGYSTGREDVSIVCDGATITHDFYIGSCASDGDLDGELIPGCGGNDCDDNIFDDPAISCPTTPYAAFPYISCEGHTSCAYCIHPGATEVCDDGQDNDCDTLTDCDDPDCVGDSACACPDADGDGHADELCGGDDCDDNIIDDLFPCPTDLSTYNPISLDCGNPKNSMCAKCINPGAPEVCDGVDNNCIEGTTDEICVECSDGIDNDGNGCADYPTDTGCHGEFDTSEDGGECPVIITDESDDNFTICHGPDQDEDSVCDTFDNCIDMFNPDQADCDDDGIGDVCDPVCDDPVCIAAGVVCDCLVPYDTLMVEEDAIICPGVYYVNDEDGVEGIIVLSKPQVSVDCSGATIIGDGTGTGIVVNNPNPELFNCNVFNYDTALYLDVPSSEIYQNTFSGVNHDIRYFGTQGASGNNIYLNYLYSIGMTTPELNDYCEDTLIEGNFYNYTIPYTTSSDKPGIGYDDCGPAVITIPPEVTQIHAEVVHFEWTRQSSRDPLTYYLEYSVDEEMTWNHIVTLTDPATLTYDWDVSALPDYEYSIKLTPAVRMPEPYESMFANGTVNITRIIVDRTGDVEGIVTCEGEPVPYASVCYYSPEGNICAQTDVDGHYLLSDVPMGDQSLVASAPEMNSERQTVFIDPEITVTADFENVCPILIDCNVDCTIVGTEREAYPLCDPRCDGINGCNLFSNEYASCEYAYRGLTLEYMDSGGDTYSVVCCNGIPTDITPEEEELVKFEVDADNIAKTTRTIQGEEGLVKMVVVTWD
ncbi:MopE-related protein [candidate division KSB1 bacterium]